MNAQSSFAFSILLLLDYLSRKLNQSLKDEIIFKITKLTGHNPDSYFWLGCRLGLGDLTPAQCGRSHVITNNRIAEQLS